MACESFTVISAVPDFFTSASMPMETQEMWPTLVAVTLDLLPKGSLGVMAWVGFSLGFDRLPVWGYTLINYPR